VVLLCLCDTIIAGENLPVPYATCFSLKSTKLTDESEFECIWSKSSN
jgi:hypothetical protein